MMLDDKVVIVNAADQTIGEMNKLLAHRYPLQRHRAVSVWLTRQRAQENGQTVTEVLLQQRSRQKIVGALWWGNTICGNVFPGETYQECALRRLKVELGITTASIQPLYKFEYHAYANEQYGEHEVDQVFVGTYDGEVVANFEEVADTLWVNLAELKTILAAWRQQNPNYPTAEGSLKIPEEDLQHQSLSVVLKLAGRDLEMVPWIIMMLLDKRLWDALK